MYIPNKILQPNSNFPYLSHHNWTSKAASRSILTWCPWSIHDVDGVLIDDDGEDEDKGDQGNKGVMMIWGFVAHG